MSWRPEKDWDALKIVNTVPEAQCHGDTDMLMDLVEAGADAMLEKIIDWLLDFEGLGEMELHFAGRRLKALKEAL